MLVLDPPPVELAQLLERRRRLGLDLYDEVWEGTYHMAPGPSDGHADLDQQMAEIIGPLGRGVGLVGRGPMNLGDPNDFRVPDRGLLHQQPDPGTVYIPSAAMVVEIVSPGDESYDKLAFYAAHGVEEALMVDQRRGGLHLYRLAGDHYEEVNRSTLLGVDVSELQAAVRWP
ncbi:MAG: Uma2 family endonuclease [Acidimicrobiales bacterium]